MSVFIEKNSKNNYKFIFSDSGHTIGNLFQKELLENEEVEFAGYRVPHPLEKKMILQIITTEKNPREYLINAINNLLVKLDDLRL